MFVSVVIPSYNRADLTLRAVNSVLAQSYKNFELILVNDGSQEDYSIFDDMLSGSPHTYLVQDNCGVASARNRGIKLSKGEYIFLLDSDDEWLPNKLEKQVEYLKNNPNCHIIQCLEKWFRFGREVTAPKNLMPSSGDLFERSLTQCFISSSSVGIAKNIFYEMGFYNEDLRICEDYDLWIRILSKYKADLINEVLAVKYSGTHPQLSGSEDAIDRYRVYALFDLIRRVLIKEISLDKLKLELVFQVLREKLMILRDGAVKRNNAVFIDFYEASINELIKEFEYIDVDKILSKLRLTLINLPKSKIKVACSIK